MHKAMTALVLALGLVALAGGPAFADCGHQSVSKETVTASAEGQSGPVITTPAPESKTN